MNKPGPKPKEIYECICCQPTHKFKTSINKAQHEYRQRTKKARTEVATNFVERDTKLEDVEYQKIFSLNDKSAFTKFKQLQQVAKTVDLQGKILIGTSIGPNSILNPEEILVEKDNSEEKGQCQGQGSSSGSYSQSSQEKELQLDSLSERLINSRQWKQASELVQVGKYENLKKVSPSKELYLSYLILISQIKAQNKHVMPSVATAIDWLERNDEVPKSLYQAVAPLFDTFKVYPNHSIEDLQILFALAKTTKASLRWMQQVDRPFALSPNPGQMMQCAHAIKAIFETKKFYSWEYFELSDYMMQYPYAADNMKLFLEVAQYPKIIVNSPWVPLFKQYVGLYSIYGRKLIKIGGKLASTSQDAISFSKLLFYTSIVLKDNCFDFAKQIIEQNGDQLDKDQFIDKLQLLKETYKLNQEQLKSQHEAEVKEEIKQRQRQEHEENLREEENQKKIKEAKEEQQKTELRKQKMHEVYHELCTLNAVVPDDQGFFEFAEKIVDLAAQLPKTLINGVPTTIVPRPEQLAVMHLLLNSQHQTTLIQLVTNFGKSLMFGLLAQYIYQKYNTKVIVVVPNETLAAIQQKKYCPVASQDGDELYNGSLTINYCTYAQFLVGGIPSNTLLLVDEIDSLFFAKHSVSAANDIKVSPLILLNKYKVIGMTATFRGVHGKNKMLAFLHNSAAFKIADIEPERDISKIEVIGRCKDVAEVEAKTVQLALEKQKEQPVIVILPTIADCERLAHQFEDCFVFGSGTVIAQLGILRFISVHADSPFPIILTTAEASLGQDLIATAYVIQTFIPASWSVFVQNAGRSNRIDPSAPLIGALITTEPVLDMASVKTGCEYLQSQAKLFAPDYLRRLEILEACAKVDANLPTFLTSFKKFKQGVSAEELYKMLSKVHKFKVALEVSGLAVQPTRINQFKEPLPKLVGQKRKTPDNNAEEKKQQQLTPQKQQNISNSMAPVCQHFECKIVYIMMPVTCTICKLKGKNAQQCGDCKKYVCSQCQEEIVAAAEVEAERNLMGALRNLQENEELMHHDALIINQPAGELSEGVLEEKEKQMTLELMAKYNLGQHQGKQSGIVSPQSKTSSQVLGLDNASESSLGIYRPAQKKREQKHQERQHEHDEDEHQERQHSPPQSPAAATNNANKRREQKQQDKLEEQMDRQSVRSGASNKSKNQHKRVKCGECGKEMRSDHLKAHQGGRKCHK